MEAMEVSTSTDSRNFHVLPRKLPLTFMEVEENTLPSTSMKASMEVNRLPWKFPWKFPPTSMELYRTEHGGLLWKSCGRSWKFVILVEVGESM